MNGAPAGRRNAAPIAAVALAAAALWAASRMTWVTVDSADGLGPPRVVGLSGSTWFGALTPLALVLLAAIAAVLATRGGLRQAVGVIVALVGGMTTVPGLALLTHSGVTAGRAKTLAELPDRAQVTQLHIHPAPGLLVLVGGVLAFVAGVWIARRRSITGLSGRYDKPAVRRAAAERRVAEGDAGEQASERVLWDALDAGEDPTDKPKRPDAGPDDDDNVA